METTTSRTETFPRPTPEQVETSLLNIAAGKVRRCIPAQATDDDVVLDLEMTALRSDLSRSAEALTVAASGLAEILAAVEIVHGSALAAAKAADYGGRTAAVAESLGHIREAVEALRASTQAAAEGR